jgi:uncharacterized membrane protein
LQQFDLTRCYYLCCNMLYIISYAVYGMAIVFVIAGLSYIILLHVFVLVGVVFERLGWEVKLWDLFFPGS